MKTLILVPDGVGMRNFLLGRFLRQVSEQGEACVLHVMPEHLLPACREGLNGGVSWHPMVPYHESLASFSLRYCLNYAQMYWGDTSAMRHTRNSPMKGGWRGRAVRQAARVVGRAAASPGPIKLLDRWHCAVVNRLPEINYYLRLYKEVRPSVIFCSHQRPPIILPALLAARELGIPTATFIFSWDNLTSKGRIAAPFDHYLVWSAHMKQELLRYYPDVPDERVHIVGTPQFDPYADKSLLWTREEFFQRIGGDSSRPLICYSGGVASISPEDPAWISIILQGIRDGRVKGRPQVLLRPAPVDERTRYDLVRSEFPELIYAEPQWTRTESRSWRDVFPSAYDVQFLTNLTYHADLNINMASTMTLDFAIRDKPVVNIAFDVVDPPHFGTPLWDFFYQWEHYRPVVELGAARFARSAEELLVHTNAYLENRSLDQDGRRRLVELQVGRPVGESARHILEVLGRIARN